MTFFNKLKNSIYSPQFYAGIPAGSFGSALGYFTLLILVVTVIQAINPIWSFATVGQKEIDKVVSRAKSAYPAGLELDIKNGEVQTNLEEPYMIPASDDKNQAEEIQNMVVIDTKTPFSTTQFNKYKTVSWVTKDSIFVRSNDNGQLRTIDLSNVKDFTLNKATVDSWITKISPWLKLITPLAIGGIILGLFVINFFRLIYFLLLALVIFILLKIFNKPLSYGNTYKVVLYAVTLGLLVESVGGLLNFQGFPFMLSLITIAVVLFNYLSAPQKTTAKKK